MSLQTDIPPTIAPKIKWTVWRWGYKQGPFCSKRWMQQTGIVFQVALFKDWAGTRHYSQPQWHETIVQEEAINSFLMGNLTSEKEKWQKLLRGCGSHSASCKLLHLSPGRENLSFLLPRQATASLESQQSRAGVWIAPLWPPVVGWKRFLYQMSKYRGIDGGENTWELSSNRGGINRSTCPV